MDNFTVKFSLISVNVNLPPAKNIIYVNTNTLCCISYCLTLEVRDARLFPTVFVCINLILVVVVGLDLVKCGSIFVLLIVGYISVTFEDK